MQRQYLALVSIKNSQTVVNFYGALWFKFEYFYSNFHILLRWWRSRWWRSSTSTWTSWTWRWPTSTASSPTESSSAFLSASSKDTSSLFTSSTSRRRYLGSLLWSQLALASLYRTSWTEGNLNDRRSMGITRRCGSVGRTSFKGPRLLQLCWWTWVRIPPQHKVVGKSLQGHLL